MSAVDVTPEPIFISAKQAARMLGLSEWSVYQLLDTTGGDGEPLIASQYQGRRRLIRYASVVAFADSLPTTAPEPAVEA